MLCERDETRLQSLQEGQNDVHLNHHYHAAVVTLPESSHECYEKQILQQMLGWLVLQNSLSPLGSCASEYYLYQTTHEVHGPPGCSAYQPVQLYASPEKLLDNFKMFFKCAQSLSLQGYVHPVS